MTAALREVTPDPVIPTRLFGTIVVPRDLVIEFPTGIPGFPSDMEFALLPAAAPAIRWLQSMTNPALAFLLVTWNTIADPLVEVVGEAYAIVTLPGSETGATANLQAPLVIDRVTRSGRQVIRTDDTPGTAVPIDLEALILPA